MDHLVYPFAGRASYILASLYLRRNYGSIFRSAQSLQLRTARRLVKDLTRSISAALSGRRRDKDLEAGS